MKFLTSALVLSFVTLSSGVSASEPKASPDAQQKFWALTERIAVALPGDGRDLQKLIPPSVARMDAPESKTRQEQRAVIGPSLFADDLAVVMGKDNRADSVSFDLSGSCIPFASVRKRYPNILVINHAASDLEWNTLGTQVGDSVIAFWFKGTKFGCMRRVEITPAATTLSRLNVD
ncbi:hypothetical protein [Stenotrophomonas maltophilia]|uniref:hypothetical protein n=1 Tax=Stenotrophomonas maltophilia TaxID=40324 RepID=UPI0015C56005|nr:hypothetical protein [Stenotrophomonas maltophilia]